MMTTPTMNNVCGELGFGLEEKCEDESSTAASTASSETLSQKLERGFPAVFDDNESSDPSLAHCVVGKSNLRRGTMGPTGRNRLHYASDVNFIPRAYSETCVKQNNYGRWVGTGPPVHPTSHRSPHELSKIHDPSRHELPACHVQATTAQAVVKPVILQTLNIPREQQRYNNEDDPDDPLLSKDSTAGDMSPSLYTRRTPQSTSSSPAGDRRGLHSHHHQYTVIPMKVIPKEEKKVSRQSGNDALCLVLSALYGKLLVVMGIAFPMSEVISTYIPPSFYDGFYLYLYFGSITFMICILGNVLRLKATRSVRTTIRNIHSMKSRLTSTGSGVAPDVTPPNDPPDISCESEEGSCSDSLPPSRVTPVLARCKIINGSVIEPHHHHHHHHHSLDEDSYAVQRIHFGSFYLRMGAVAFGIGSMIYSGLEFGQYFELQPDTKCHNILIALTPSVRMMFTFMQMYFIFLNSKMAVTKFRLGSQFGLMHMIGTNMCVWLNVLVQETRHEILQFYNPDNNTITLTHGYARGYGPAPGGHGGGGHGYSMRPTMMTTTTTTTTTTTASPLQNLTGAAAGAGGAVANMIISAGENIAHRIVKRGLKGPHSIYECRRTNIMGALVQNASPFLFPCTIEYSLICAAILYVMWKSLAKKRGIRDRSIYAHGDAHLYPGAKRSPHHYSVDCARANKGLFLGIFVLVLTIISLIIFFVLISRPGFQELATMEVNITELALYTTTTVAVLIGMCQMRELKYVRGRNLELDNILLIVAQTGSFIYNVFTIIGGHFMMRRFNVFVLITALASLIQLLFQTLFILDASKRSAATADQARRKPGREVVTFLLVTNLAMWAINTLEKSRADSHPVQLRFYGVWAWTIITHISMPLAIFYRFHSTVCLCEIWKRAYKIKHSSAFH